MGSVSPIRVMIVDDHPLVSDGLKLSLQAATDIELVGQAGNGHEALRLCAECQPDMILMDIMLPELDGIAVTQAILKQYPQTKIVMLSALGDEELIQRAIKAGARGYLLKTIKPAELIAAIRLAHAGQFTLAPAAIQALLKQPPAEPDFSLTRREREVLALLSQGVSNEQIAARLLISLSTVRFHVTNIFAKLGAANRAEAAALAVKHHLIG